MNILTYKTGSSPEGHMTSWWNIEGWHIP
jgi:hypothetical protein